MTVERNQPGPPVISYRKSEAAKPSYALYTAGRPASWEVLVNGVACGSLRGVARQYSRSVSYIVTLNGRQVRESPGSLRGAKALVAKALEYGSEAPHWFYLPAAPAEGE